MLAFAGDSRNSKLLNVRRCRNALVSEDSSVESAIRDLFAEMLCQMFHKKLDGNLLRIDGLPALQSWVVEKKKLFETICTAFTRRWLNR